METFIQLSINGLSNGAILALAALGFVLIYKATGVINFAQGEFLLIAGFVIWFMLVEVGLPWFAGIAVAVLVGIALGLVIERLILRPMVGEPVDGQLDEGLHQSIERIRSVIGRSTRVPSW